jgi:excisionase family DNA binding protein
MARPASDWITLQEAVEILAAANVRLSESTLSRWTRSGKLQSIRPGRRIYVRKAQIRSLLKPQRRGVPADELQSSLFEWET